MNSSDRDDKKPLESVLWNDDWGIPQADLTEEQATRRGLVLLRGRWVPESDKLDLDKLLTAKRFVRTGPMVGLGMLIAWMIFLFPSFISYGGPGFHPGLSGLLALLSVQIVSAIALRSYQKWAWYVFTFSPAIVTVLLLFVRFVGLDDTRGFAGAVLLTLGFPAAGYLLFLLVKPEIRQIFRKERLTVIHSLRPEPNFGPIFKLMGVGLLIFLNVFLDTYFYHDSQRRSGSRCERAACGDVSKLAAAIERLQSEIVDSNCQGDAEKILERGVNLEYLVGPYYGWKGTSQRCGVLVRVVGREVQACSPKGSRPSLIDQSLRYVYRQTLVGGADLPAIEAPCEGRSYGGPEDSCFTTSMVGPDCTLRRPKESKKCKEIH
jgi:hypothetical protein